VLREQQLQRLHRRGPWRDPDLQQLLAGKSHTAKVAELDSLITQLRRLLR
jgi:hypothetical protein